MTMYYYNIIKLYYYIYKDNVCKLFHLDDESSIHVNCLVLPMTVWRRVFRSKVLSYTLSNKGMYENLWPIKVLSVINGYVKSTRIGSLHPSLPSFSSSPTSSARDPERGVSFVRRVVLCNLTKWFRQLQNFCSSCFLSVIQWVPCNRVKRKNSRVD